MSVASGTKVESINDELLNKSYLTAKKILESGGSYLKPFVIFKTFEEKSGLITIPLNKKLDDIDEFDFSEIVTNELIELCNQKKISDVYITVEMQRTNDENNLPIMIPEYYISITHETHLFSDNYISKILMNDDEKVIVGPLYKLDEGQRLGSVFNILYPKVFHTA